jgi:hypothetical protein
MPVQPTTAGEIRLDVISRFCDTPRPFHAGKRPRNSSEFHAGLRNFGWHVMEDHPMKLHRFVPALLVALASATVVCGEGWTPRPFASQVQTDAREQESAPVQKDDSQLWVVERRKDAPPIVDVAGKTKRKSAPSGWSRLWRPSQWFSGAKAKK